MKRFFSVFLFVAILIGVFPVGAEAKEMNDDTYTIYFDDGDYAVVTT